MKILLSISMLVATLAAAAQESRDLKLVVRNAKGRIMRDLPIMAQLKGADRVLELDRSGTGRFTATDADTLMMVLSGRVWEFPLEGLDSLCVVLKNRSVVAGYMVPREGDRRGELVNVGYGTISRSNNTAAMSTLDMSGIEAYTDLMSYMRGRVAGVTFVNGQLVIRGVNSLLSDIEALVVVDGVPLGSFSTANDIINPQDVASVTVLKDAASTAIYGTRGANGVVLITTKTGREATR